MMCLGALSSYTLIRDSSVISDLSQTDITFQDQQCSKGLSSWILQNNDQGSPLVVSQDDMDATVDHMSHLDLR